MSSFLQRRRRIAMGGASEIASPLTITGSSVGAQTDYPVRVNVTYDSRMKTDLSDIHFQDANNAELSYWQESYITGTSAVFWVKIPSIPANPNTVGIRMKFGNRGRASTANGTNVFSLYDHFDHVTLKPNAHAPNAAAPAINTAGLVAENIVFDSTTNKYWWIFEDRRSSPAVITLASADTITGTWTVEASPVISEASHILTSPCLVKFGATWYIYYGRCDDGTNAPGDIFCQSSATVNSGYSATGITNPVLARGSAGTWEANRVLEPYVFYDGTQYRMFYMGETTATFRETTGMATSADPVSGWTKAAGNPVIPGNTGVWDVGSDRAADPHVIYANGHWYIGITACATGKSGWKTGFYWTDDWTTFYVCQNPVLDHGSAGSFDETATFRGGVLLVGSTYYFSYCGVSGGTYKPALTTVTFVSDYAGLTIPSVDLPLWVATGTPSMASSILTEGNTTFLASVATFGQGYALRGRMLMKGSPGNGNAILAFRGSPQFLQFVANAVANQIAVTQHKTSDTSTANVAATGSYLIFDVIRNGNTNGIYNINDINVSTKATQIPDASLPVLVYGGSDTDWVVVRKYVNPEPVASF